MTYKKKKNGRSTAEALGVLSKIEADSKAGEDQHELEEKMKHVHEFTEVGMSVDEDEIISAKLAQVETDESEFKVKPYELYKSSKKVKDKESKKQEE